MTHSNDNKTTTIEKLESDLMELEFEVRYEPPGKDRDDAADHRDSVARKLENEKITGGTC